MKKVVKIRNSKKVSDHDRRISVKKAKSGSKPSQSEYQTYYDVSYVRNNSSKKSGKEIVRELNTSPRRLDVIKSVYSDVRVEFSDRMKFIEVYKDWKILQSEDGSYVVISPKNRSRFIIGLDDSKIGGNRSGTESSLEGARAYIDYRGG